MTPPTQRPGQVVGGRSSSSRPQTPAEAQATNPTGNLQPVQAIKTQDERGYPSATTTDPYRQNAPSVQATQMPQGSYLGYHKELSNDYHSQIQAGLAARENPQAAPAQDIQNRSLAMSIAAAPNVASTYKDAQGITRPTAAAKVGRDAPLGWIELAAQENRYPTGVGNRVSMLSPQALEEGANAKTQLNTKFLTKNEYPQAQWLMVDGKKYSGDAAKEKVRELTLTGRLNEIETPPQIRRVLNPPTIPSAPLKAPTIETSPLQMGLLPEIANKGGLIKDFKYNLQLGGPGEGTQEKVRFRVEPDMSDIDAMINAPRSSIPLLSDIYEPVFKSGMAEYRNIEYERRSAVMNAKSGADILGANIKASEDVKGITNVFNQKVTWDLGAKYTSGNSYVPIEETAQRLLHLDIPIIDIQLNTAGQAVMTQGIVSTGVASAAIGAGSKTAAVVYGAEEVGKFGIASAIGGKVYDITGSESLSLTSGIVGYGITGKAIGAINARAFPYNRVSETAYSAKRTQEFTVGQQSVATTISKDIYQGAGKPLMAVGVKSSTGLNMGAELPVHITAKNILGESKIVPTYGGKTIFTTKDIGLGSGVGNTLTSGIIERMPRYGSTSGVNIGGRQPIVQQDAISSVWVGEGANQKLFGGTYRVFTGEKKIVGNNLNVLRTEGQDAFILDSGSSGRNVGSAFKSYKSVGVGSVNAFGEKVTPGMIQPTRLDVSKLSRANDNVLTGSERISSQFGRVTSQKNVPKYMETFTRTSERTTRGRSGGTVNIPSGGWRQQSYVKMELDTAPTYTSATRSQAVKSFLGQQSTQSQKVFTIPSMSSVSEQKAATTQLSAQQGVSKSMSVVSLPRQMQTQLVSQISISRQMQSSHSKQRTIQRQINRQITSPRQLQRQSIASEQMTKQDVLSNTILPRITTTGPMVAPSGFSMPKMPDSGMIGGGGGGGGRRWKKKSQKRIKLGIEGFKVTGRLLGLTNRKKRRR
jgi:hypothetical protein